MAWDVRSHTIESINRSEWRFGDAGRFCPVCAKMMSVYLRFYDGPITRCDGCGASGTDDLFDQLQEETRKVKPSNPATFARTWLHLHRSAEGEL